MRQGRVRYVLDSFALIAYLEDESGAEKVGKILTQAAQRHVEVYLCSINLGEVYYITYRERGGEKAEETLAIIDLLPIHQVEADRDLVLSAARIKAVHAISYADAFAVALAYNLNAKVVTGDPEFRKLKEIVEVVRLS